MTLNERTLKLIDEVGLNAKDRVLAEAKGLDLYRMASGEIHSRVTCGRCGGSGHYSYCTAFHTACFECNVGRTGSMLDHVGWVFEPAKKTINRWKRAATAERKAEKRHAALAAEADMLAAAGFVPYLAVWNSAALLVERIKEDKRLAALAKLGHVGAVGGRLELDVTVTNYFQFPDRFNPRRYRELVRFADAAGNVLVWWTTSCPGDLAERGAKARIKATVKAHETYAKTGEPQTVVTRVSVIEVAALVA